MTTTPSIFKGPVPWNPLPTPAAATAKLLALIAEGAWTKEVSAAHAELIHAFAIEGPIGGWTAVKELAACDDD